MQAMKVMLTGASGAMGRACLKELTKDKMAFDLVLMCLDTPEDRFALKAYQDHPQIKIAYGDITDAKFVRNIMQDIDLVVHMAALVSPKADYFPERTMEVNYGGMENLLSAIAYWNQMAKTRLVSIGTIAQTGDRMPGIHWGRIGDPMKPSMFDYYAVSKVAAERVLIESGLTYWVSLRQTGMMGPTMASIKDPIMFHNGLNNVLEYVSDRDSGRLVAHLCQYLAEGSLADSFWGHIYNIGGGKSCRLSGYDMYRGFFSRLGFADVDKIIEPRLYASHNFHGHFFLDSDILEDYLHFRQDDLSYLFDCLMADLGWQGKLLRSINRLPFGQKLTIPLIRSIFRRIAKREHGSLYMLKHHQSDKIEAFWGSKANWQALPKSVDTKALYTDWEQKIWIDHGYDESVPEEALCLEMLQEAAEFRGGRCLSDTMTTGDWTTPLDFSCSYGHLFKASPRLVLEGGHFCPECERRSWNYGQRAKREPFLNQVWAPLHGPGELREYPKKFSDKTVDAFRAKEMSTTNE